MFFKKRFKKIYKNKIRKLKNKYNKKHEQERNKFICVLNHDVKTPILAQIQTLELILNDTFGKLDPKTREILTQTLSSSYFLYQIITDTLFLVKYENEKPKLNIESVDIVKQIQKCTEMVRTYAKDKQQEIIFKINKNKNIKLNADRKLIQKIIFNLLASSISSGFEKSKIEISVKENKNTISFFTKNKSIYMTKEKINSLFEEKKTPCDFNQLGMSLNLNIVKKLIEAHNWNIIAASDKNNSSTFGFIVQK